MLLAVMIDRVVVRAPGTQFLIYASPAYGLQGGDDDDDLDLFGEETAEEKALNEQREAAAKKAPKKVVGKWSIHSVSHIHV